MSKTNIVILVLVAFTLVAGALGLYLVLQPKDAKDSSASSDFSENTAGLPSIAERELTYKDASGFSFKYISGYQVSDVTPDDDQTYSVVNLAKGSDTLTLSIQDTKYTSLTEWEKDNKTASVVGAVNLSGMSAKQYLMGASLLTVAIDQGVIYIIDGKESESYTLLTNTFAFSDPNVQTADAVAGSDIIYEEEEIVE